MDTLSVAVASRPEVAIPPERHTSRLPEIEVLRTIAVLMVMAEHIPLNLVFWPSRFADNILGPSGLWTGVDLFFAISGFVIARSLLPRLADVTDWMNFTRIALVFWIARAWRLFPSAWFWLTAPLLLCLVFNHSGAYGSFQSNFGLFVAGMLDMVNFHIAEVFGRYGSGTAFPQWSLSLEEQFYLLLPFAAFFFRRYLFIPLILVALMGFLVPNTVLTLQLRLWPVAFGVLLALWSAHPTYRECVPTALAKNRLARTVLLAVALTCLIGVGSQGLHVVPFYQGPVAVVSVFLVWVASYNGGYLWQPGYSRRAMEAIAARSYSLYLVHIPVYFGAHEIWYRFHKLVAPTKPQAAVLVVLAALAVACVAELNHRLLERPLRARGRQIAAAFQARKLMEMA